MRSYISLRYLCVLFVIFRVNLGHCKNIQEHDKDNNNNNNNNITTTIIPTTKPNAYDEAANKSSVANEKCHEYSNMIHGRKANSRSDAIYQSINETYCNVTTFIVGGEKAEPKEFPHMALLGFEFRGVKTWYCGGSLISNNWILTTAHCIYNDTKRNLHFPSLARLGELNYFEYTDDARPRDYKIVQTVVHPKYEADFQYSHDIALLRLDDVEFSAYVRPICLNTERTLKVKHALATGWGKIRHDKLADPMNPWNPMNRDLLKVALNIIPTKKCNRILSSIVDFALLNLTSVDGVSQICAGYLRGGKDTCIGDSGGPLQIDHPKYACMYLQIGITSYGYNCGEQNRAAIYTRVSNYIPWIEQIVWPKSE